MKDIITLTKEYASNLNCLFFQFNESSSLYCNEFSKIFNTCIVSNDLNFDIKNHTTKIDIVFINIDSDREFKNKNDMKNFINILRTQNDFLHVYAIDDNLPVEIKNLLDSCYCLDGTLPTPFNKDGLYTFMYRILERITEIHYLHMYIISLEETLPTAFQVHQANTIEKKMLDVLPKYNIRESFVKNSENTEEFYSFLSYEDVVKAEDLSSKLELHEVDILALMQTNDLEKIKEHILSSVAIFTDMSNFMSIFDDFNVACESATHIGSYIEGLDYDSFSDSSKKEEFVNIYVSILEDSQKWIKILFVDNDTENINYFDASFANSCLELEAVFSANEEDDDESDLEFF